MTGRFSTAVTEVGGALNRSVHGISDEVRKLAEDFVTADCTGAQAASRADPDVPLLFGQGRITGLYHTFTPDQVRSLPILSPDKEVVGVHFPSKLRDAKRPMVFTRDGFESAKHGDRQWTRGRGPQQPEWVYRRTAAAPWGQEVVFAQAHAQKNGYDIQVAKKIPLTKWRRWVPTRVNGETYGTILAADKHFKQAVKSAPTAELIQMSCSPAAGPAPRESAEALIQQE
ncbi:hypothetical protein [Nocardia gamkensis]|uniref:hypothetical protein n=1 Tax=Nocardia gamkensis TaxID=352869 RepID=UPI0037C8858A